MAILLDNGCPGGGFNHVYFSRTWGRFPFGLIFFRWVETTDQWLFSIGKHVTATGSSNRMHHDGGPVPSSDFLSMRSMIPSLKLTFSPLKMDGWNTIVSFCDGLFSGANC